MNNISVRSAVATYLAADKSKEPEMLGQCFGEDAVVRDEGREHRGIAAIKTWKREADAKYRYVLEPLDATTTGSTAVVRARVTGDFPGSPVVLRLQFGLAGDRIQSLEVAL